MEFQFSVENNELSYARINASFLDAIRSHGLT